MQKISGEVIILPVINIKAFIGRMRRFHNGINTGGEIFCQYIDRVFDRVFHRKTDYYVKSRAKRMRPELWHEEDKTYHIKDMRFPELNEAAERNLLGPVFDDTFCSYYYFDDKYDEATVDYCDVMLGEGLYGLVNDKVNVTVEPGDIVIDAGAWIGDFAAYASVRGATTYAFEPLGTNFAILQKTAELNGNIIPVMKGLSDENTSRDFFINTATGSSSSFLEDSKFLSSNNREAKPDQAETVRLDDFVRENNLPRVDFIKCDIEGFERHMLAGAQETLARFAPKLALCTYHLPDDPKVMAALIKQANPKYNIVQKRHKLYASVPNE